MGTEFGEPGSIKCETLGANPGKPTKNYGWNRAGGAGKGDELCRGTTANGYGIGEKNFGMYHPHELKCWVETIILNNELGSDKGKLGGNYGQLEKQDQAIHFPGTG